MSTIAPPIRGKAWVWQITALCIILGALLALSLKTQRQAISQGEPGRSSALGDVYRDIKKQNVDLQRELSDYKARLEKLAKMQAKGLYGTNDIVKVLEDTKMVAGTIAVHGPGIVVLLQDSPRMSASGVSLDAANEYIIHDQDIRDVVNELFAAGAEAISVNGQRIVASSSIRCAGNVVLVNLTRVAPPFVIKAIGVPETLDSGFRMPQGVWNDLSLLDMVKIEKDRDIVIPAYTGVTRFTCARPVPQSRR